jgi:hypothetical protein
MSDIATNKAELGCGTLILIALIVMIFSNCGNKVSDLRNDVQSLTREVNVLQQKVDALTQAILKNQRR